MKKKTEDKGTTTLGEVETKIAFPQEERVGSSWFRRDARKIAFVSLCRSKDQRVFSRLSASRKAKKSVY